MGSEKTVRFLTNLVAVMFYVMVFTNAAFAQVQLTGQGGSEIMQFLARVTNFAFYITISACLVSLMFAGYKLTKGDQQGMQAVWTAAIGTAIVAGASGILKYFVFAAQDTGMSNNGSTPF